MFYRHTWKKNVSLMKRSKRMCASSVLVKLLTDRKWTSERVRVVAEDMENVPITKAEKLTIKGICFNIE